MFARARIHKINATVFGLVQIGLAAYSFALPIILTIAKDSALGDIPVHTTFLVLTLIISFLVGMEFTVATKLLHQRSVVIASTLYGVDLMGSALGALLVSMFAIPLLGIASSGFVISFLCTISAAASLLSDRRGAARVTAGGRYV